MSRAVGIRTALMASARPVVVPPPVVVGGLVGTVALLAARRSVAHGAPSGESMCW